MPTQPFDDDKLHEECGVYGIFGHQDAAALTALGLHALQHRGQEGAGIVAGDGTDFSSHRTLGLVGDTFSDSEVIDTLKGNRAIGHNRYSTAGGKALRNVQPIFADFQFGGLAIAHNGNLTNSNKLRRRLVKQGAIFQSTMDTEVFIHLIATSRYEKVTDRLIDAVRQVKGAYSLVVLTQKKLIGMRDPLGVRPLVIGKLGDAYILASETVALDIANADFVRDVEPGEVVVISDQGLQSIKPFHPPQSRFCIFEYIYFARPDSVLDGVSVYDARKAIGAELAHEAAVEDADYIVPVPDSGVPAALGFAQASNIPFELGIIRNHYVGRTFIEPTDQIRHLGVKLKHNANMAKLKGRKVVLVDDSIVRGTTSMKIVEMVRAAGAREVHMRISSPPTAHSCYYGIDTPTREKLLASRHDTGSMAKTIGADSLAFISIDGLYRAVGRPGRDAAKPAYCDACFTGDYPIDLVDHDADDTASLTRFSEGGIK